MPNCGSRRATIPTSRIWQRIHASQNCSIPIPANWVHRTAISAKKSLPSLQDTFMEIQSAESGPPEKTVRERGLRVVAIGGGTGLSTLLKGLKRFVLWSAEIPAQPDAPSIRDLSAIVTVSDD